MSAMSKIRKQDGAPADSFEKAVASIIADIESSNKDLAADLKPLYFTSAKEIDVSGGRKSIVLFVPVPLLRSFQKIHTRLVREIEKKFSDKHVLIIGNRKIVSKTTRQKQQRPRSRTLTAVHENILNDLVFPTEIVGKRTRINVDGSRLMKVHLDNKDQSTLEHKLETFSAVYKKITGKNTSFLFSVQSE